MNVSWPWPTVKRNLVFAAALLAAMLILWWLLWAIGAAQYRNFIDNWIEAHRALGYQVTYDSRETAGFPNNVSLHFSNFVLQNPDGVRVHANDVLLSAFPWQWRRFDAKLKSGFELTIPFTNDKTLLIGTAETVRNHTELDENGDWKFVNLALTNAKALWGTEPLFGAGAFAFALERPGHPPKDHHDTGLTFSALAENLALPGEFSEPFGANVKKVDVALRVMGPVPDPRLRDSVAAWNNDSGVLEFDKFFLEWGPLLLSTKGTLGLDDDLQPEGAFSAQIGNDKEVLKTLLAHDYIPKREAGMLDSALDLFTKKVTVSGKPGIEAPIAVQLGGLYLGPVHVFGFPEIEWGTEQPAVPVVAPAPAPTETPPATPASPAR